VSLPPPPGGIPPRPAQGDPFQPHQQGQPPYVNGPEQHGYPGPHTGPAPWPQQQAPHAPAPAPPTNGGGGRWKWAVISLALLAVIGVTVAITVVVLGRNGTEDGNHGSTSNTASPSNGNKANSDIASANDTGPVAVITEDPSCAPMGPVLDARASEQTKNGWDKRDPSVPASEWTPEIRTQYEAVGKSMRTSADQLVPIAKLTPHRVMRELYEQIIAYSRAFADSIGSYTAVDDHLAGASISAFGAIDRICAAISYGSAATRGPLVPALDVPSDTAPVGDLSAPDRFLRKTNPVCQPWDESVTQFLNDTKAWGVTSPDIPANQWSPEQKAINDDVSPIMTSFADKLIELGDQSNDPMLRDLADLSAQYRRAYVLALANYVPADKYLAQTSILLSGVVLAACQAATN
jgi:hypothetical protein